MAYRRNVKRLVFLMLLAGGCISASAVGKNFNKTLQVTSVETQTDSQVKEGTGGASTWLKIVGQVDGQGYSFKSFCGWRRRCDWLLPGEFPARWISRSGLEVEYHDNKGQLKTEKIYVLEVYDATPEGKSAQMSPEPTSKTPNSGSSLASRVRVTSIPDGADIEIDGSFVGNTPSTVEVATGEHTVVIKKVGYQMWERNLKVSGGDIRLSAELEKTKK